MLVECRDVDPGSRPAMDLPAMLTPGRRYPVLGMALRRGSAGLLHVVTDDGRPSHVPMDRFAIIDGRIPEAWQSRLFHEGAVYLGYPPFADVGAIEMYVGGDPAVTAAVRGLVGTIYREAGLAVPELHR